MALALAGAAGVQGERSRPQQGAAADNESVLLRHMLGILQQGACMRLAFSCARARSRMKGDAVGRMSLVSHALITTAAGLLSPFRVAWRCSYSAHYRHELPLAICQD
jgi:hypothetical protein